MRNVPACVAYVTKENASNAYEVVQSMIPSAP